MDDEKYSDEDLLFMCAGYISSNYTAMLDLNEWKDDVYGINVGFLTARLENWNDYPSWALIRENHPDLARYIEILANRNPYLMRTLDWLFKMRALNPFMSTSERLERLKDSRETYSAPRFYDQTKVSINKYTGQRQYELMTKLNQHIQSIELSLFERITQLVLEDASAHSNVQKFMDKRIPAIELLKIIRHMAGSGEAYNIGQTDEERLVPRLLLGLTYMHKRGYTFEDFMGGSDRDMLQLFRRLAHRNLIELTEVEQVFDELDNEDIMNFLKTIESLAQNDMTVEEFMYGSGPVWSTLTLEQAALIRKAYRRYGARADVSAYIDQIFQNVLEMYKNRLLDMIPGVIVQGIGYSEFLFGVHVPAIDALKRVRHVPRILKEIRDAFIVTQNFITEQVLEYIRQVIVHNPGLTYQGFFNAELNWVQRFAFFVNADTTFMSEGELERFSRLYELVQTFENFSDVQKRIQKLFQGFN